MKKLLFGLVALFIVSESIAQKKDEMNTEINKKTSWLKAGLSASVPVGDISNYSSFAVGVELSGQFMETKHFGLGIATGYTEFFAKENSSSFGAIPLGLMLRYYPEYKGFFVGTDIGYTFLTNSNASGGFYIKPQAGYHNYDWNFYAFYNDVMTSSNYINVENLGVAATYNIRFK
ncbi:MAG: hypothetical protein WDM71_10530 [Ferruginibacter sp.]